LGLNRKVVSKKEYLWSELTRKNPRLLDDPHFTPASMRKFYDRVYEAAWSAGYMTNNSSPSPEAADIFSTIFGQKP
jgi:hypothetical protein